MRRIAAKTQDHVKIHVYFRNPSLYRSKKSLCLYRLSSGTGPRSGGKAAFDWRPFKLEIGSRAGSDPEAFLRRARYIYRDVRRFAGPLGLTVRGPTKIYDSMTALVGLLYAKSAGVHRAYIATAFTKFFNRELDPGDVEAVGAPRELRCRRRSFRLLPCRPRRRSIRGWPRGSARAGNMWRPHVRRR